MMLAERPNSTTIHEGELKGYTGAIPMRTQANQWQAVVDQQDKAFGRLQSTDPLLVSRVWSDLLGGRPISIQGPSGQVVTLDRDRPRILCDATVIRRFDDTNSAEGFKPVAPTQRQQQK